MCPFSRSTAASQGPVQPRMPVVCCSLMPSSLPCLDCLLQLLALCPPLVLPSCSCPPAQAPVSVEAPCPSLSLLPAATRQQQQCPQPLPPSQSRCTCLVSQPSA